MKNAASIFLLLFSLTAAFGQRAAKVTAWIDLQQSDGKVVISCWCQNHTSSPLHLRYKAVLFDQDSSVQTGKTLALPDQPNLLLNGNFLVPDGEFERVVLQVFLKDELVATAQAVGPKPTPFASTEAPASSQLNEEISGFDDTEIQGLILDETHSKLAQDFYELFFNNWSSVEEDIKTNFTITFREQPNIIGIGSRVMVELNGEEVLQLNLQPRREIIETLALQLVESLYSQIMNPDQSYQEINTDDISGSGIY